MHQAKRDILANNGIVLHRGHLILRPCHLGVHLKGATLHLSQLDGSSNEFAVCLRGKLPFSCAWKQQKSFCKLQFEAQVICQY